MTRKRVVLIERTVRVRKGGKLCSQSCDFFRQSWSRPGPVCDLLGVTARLVEERATVARRSPGCIEAERAQKAREDW